MEDVASLKTSVEKEIKKIQYYGTVIQQHMENKDIPKLQRVVDATIPNKLNLMEDLIEKTSEMMIEEDVVLSEIQKWTLETRQSIEETVCLTRRGKSLVESYYKQKADETNAEIMEEEKCKKEKERREAQIHEEKIYAEKLERERAAWREHQEIALETKRIELEMEKKMKSQNAKLPKLTIAPFQGTTKDWIRFYNQYHVQVDNQPVSKTVKFGYLLQLVNGPCRNLIGNIPNTDEGYDRAMELLRKEFGQEQAVIASHTKEIIEMGVVLGTKYSRVKDFYDTLAVNYEALRAMGAHRKVEGLVISSLEKLPHVKPDITRNDENWEEWTYDELLEELRKWLKRNQVEESASRRSFDKTTYGGERKNRAFMVADEKWKPREKAKPRCFYCPRSHWPDHCDTITAVHERKDFLKKRGLCFKCGEQHMVKDCKKRGCFQCRGNHHVSIHEERKQKIHVPLPAADISGYTFSGDCVMPLIPFDVKGVEIWGILDTGSTKNWITTRAVRMLKLVPERWEETKLRTAEGDGKYTKKPVYRICTYAKGGEKLAFEAVGLDQEDFSVVERSTSKQLRERYPHLQGLHIPDSKDGRYVIQLLIGDPLFTRIRTGRSVTGKPGEPIADETVFGWTVHGEESKADHSYFTRTTNEDYEQLYSLDVLGVEDRKEFDQEDVKREFLENIQRKEDGRYQIRIPWIEGRYPINDNQVQSSARLNSLFRRMTAMVRTEYNKIIEEQLEMGIIEMAPEEVNGKRVFYMPHKPVVREGATSTKVRMVFDASSKPSREAYSINECMNPGPTLQPLLWDIMIRSRMAPVCVVGDVTKAFLQIEVHPDDRDAFRFLYRTENGDEVHLRFCRLPFGGESSPFVLDGVLQHHLQTVGGNDTVKKQLKENTYVDNVMGLVNNEEQAVQFKEEAIRIMEKGQFPLAKWESNIQLLDENSEKVDTKLLGINWNKQRDTYAVDVNSEIPTRVTQRDMLKRLASIYDPLGLLSPALVNGKHLYRMAVDEKKGWDGEISEELKSNWIKWVCSLKTVEVPRTIAPYLEEVTAVDLHHTMDASGKAVSAQTVAVVIQPTGITKGLLTSKSRIAKRGLTIPRQELVACQMGANLAANLNKALEGWPIRENNCWTDSKVALCWINNPFKNWKSFVSNRVRQIFNITNGLNLNWRHVPTEMNSADYGSRGASIQKLERVEWWKGADWLTDRSRWPLDTKQLEGVQNLAEEELKQNSELVLIAMDKENDEWETLLQKSTLKKANRVTAWCLRFCTNTLRKKEGKPMKSGPLKTEELTKAESYWIRREQRDINLSSKEAQQLGLTTCDDGIIRCIGRIINDQPIFLPRESTYAARICEDAHRKVGHKSVNFVIAAVRSEFWIPRLRTIVKHIKRECESCKILMATPYSAPDAGPLPLIRTTAKYPFAVTGVDFVGPFCVKGKEGEDKAYVIVFSCATSRGVHFATSRSMETSEFIDRLNDFIAVHTRPEEIISDNAQTFKATAMWMGRLMKSEALHDYLADHGIKWNFILARSPWRGGFYERMNRDMKAMIWQKLGKSHLSFEGFTRVIKDIEIIFNNRPLQYVEDELGPRVLTPNRIIHGRDIHLLEETEEQDSPSKMEKRIRKAKEVMWQRWTTEYVRSLRERHDVTKRNSYHPEVGEVVLIVGDSKNRRRWSHGLVCELLKGKDEVVRGVRMVVRNKIWERPIQLICPLEIKSKMTLEELNKRIRVANNEDIPPEREQKNGKVTRKARELAQRKIRSIAEESEHYL